MDERPSHDNAHSTRQLTGPDSHESQRLTPSSRAGLRPPPRCHLGLQGLGHSLSGDEQHLRPPRAGHGQHQLQITEHLLARAAASAACGRLGSTPLKAPRQASYSHSQQRKRQARRQRRESGAASDRKPLRPPHGACPRSRAAWPRLLPQKDPLGASQRAQGCHRRQAGHTSTAQAQHPATGPGLLLATSTSPHRGQDLTALSPAPMGQTTRLPFQNLPPSGQVPRVPVRAPVGWQGPGRHLHESARAAPPGEAEPPAALHVSAPAQPPIRPVSPVLRAAPPRHNTAIVTVQLHLSPQGRQGLGDIFLWEPGTGCLPRPQLTGPDPSPSSRAARDSRAERQAPGGG